MHDVILAVSDRFGWGGSLGIGFPGVVRHGQIRTTAHGAGVMVGVDLELLLAPYLQTRSPVVAAGPVPDAGIVGAALARRRAADSQRAHGVS